MWKFRICRCCEYLDPSLADEVRLHLQLPMLYCKHFEVLQHTDDGGQNQKQSTAK